VRSVDRMVFRPSIDSSARFGRFKDKRVVGLGICDAERNLSLEQIGEQIAADFGPPALGQSWSRLLFFFFWTCPRTRCRKSALVPTSDRETLISAQRLDRAIPSNCASTCSS